MIMSRSAKQTKNYFSDSLSKSDYYISDIETKGCYHGKLARRLELPDIADKKTFFSLCENIHPITGKPLTPRKRADRTTAYDINFHVPKSLSVVNFLSKNDDILKAFQESVYDTMKDIEDDSQCRVRTDGRDEDRNTGELVWAEFIHHTSRPVQGSVSDPHLHAHCVVMNATFDPVEQKYKAGQFRHIQSSMPYHQARFHKRLSDKMVELGYQVRLTKTSFEIDNIDPKVLALFSKRTDEIGRVAKEKSISDAKQLDSLGARTRTKKHKDLSLADLKKEWRRQIKQLEQDGKSDGDTIIRHSQKVQRCHKTAEDAVDYAIKHSFERVSVMPDRRLLASAYRFALGNPDTSLDAITDSFKGDTRVITVTDKGRTMCTTKEVLAEEQQMVKLAKQGQGKMRPLYDVAPDLTLNGQQADAVNHILTTSNRVSIIRGAAGTGKTTLMREAVKQIEAKGLSVFTCAPTAEAARGVLKEEGFCNAETVAKLLNDPCMQADLKNQALWVDESGLLSTNELLQLLILAEKQNARLILGGDTRQHSSVVRGDALRILNTVGGIHKAEVSKIYRQHDARYREAVEYLSKGNIQSAFEQLDNLGFIKVIDPLKPNNELVDAYVSTIKQGRSALVISPTHKQGEVITNHIREELQNNGLIEKDSVCVTKLSNLNLTEAQKTDSRNYIVGQIIQFSQNLSDIPRGSRWTVKDAVDNAVIIENSKGQFLPLPSDKAAAFDVFHRSEIPLVIGDKIRITRNGYDENRKRLNNGATLEVASISDTGQICLKSPKSKASYVIDPHYGHIDHAYCVSSYASQGKTVDEVFIHQPASTFVATDAKQLYVSVSRARHAAWIYTDDKRDLLEHASETGDRQSALELVGIHTNHKTHIDYLTRSHQAKNESVIKVLSPDTTPYYRKKVKHDLQL